MDDEAERDAEGRKGRVPAGPAKFDSTAAGHNEHRVCIRKSIRPRDCGTVSTQSIILERSDSGLYQSFGSGKISQLPVCMYVCMCIGKVHR